MEYKILEAVQSYKLSMEINRFAKEGWEVMTVFPKGTLLFAVMQRMA
jgi:Domain of unknown function (DUF4177)